jgi:selenocysteine lyase/cysteine desulfurase
MLIQAADRATPRLAPPRGAFDFAALRRREFARLDARRHSYLDYTGSALYAASQLRAHVRLLRSGIFGNPHSESSTARASTAIIGRARDAVLDFLHVDASTHVVCFCANASAAIKLVAESYPFAPQRQLLLSADNHNSVNGMREYARAAQAPVRILPLDAALALDRPHERLEGHARDGAGLFAFPAQSNFSGAQHPLSLVEHARALGFDVLLDCAAFIPSHPLDLRACPADFAVLSFYKLFGYPTGLGALVLRREAMRKLRRPWFAGGTVRFASVGADLHRLADDAEGFEDGTPDFLGIAALPAGFALLEEVGMDRLHAHVARLTQALLDGLTRLRRKNGQPSIRIHGPRIETPRGGAVSFSVLDESGRALPYAMVEAAAREAGISVRGGCFCNPGAAEAAFGVEPERLKQCLVRLDGEFTPQRLSTCAGTEVGAIRASVGLANNDDDVARLLELLDGFAERVSVG